MTLVAIERENQIRSAVQSIRRRFRDEGFRQRRSLGYQAGDIPADVYSVEQAGLWMAYRPFPARHVLCFGLLPIPEHGNLTINVEINPPRQGYDGRVGGIIARDDASRLFLCHTGKLGGGRKGIGKSAFIEWLGRTPSTIVIDGNRETSAFPVAQLDSRNLIAQIAEFVRSCAAFKAGESLESAVGAPPMFGGADDEFEGTKTVAASGPYTASCDHGIIRNRLTILLRDAGLKVGRDQARDLFVGSRSKPEAEFEIKTGCDPQSVYTSVGQLLMHSVATPAKSKIAVLPSPVPLKARKALKSLGLHLIQYRWTKTSIHFDGLADLYPDANTSAPINPTT